MVRDQLAESIDAAEELQKGGKTVSSKHQHSVEKDEPEPTSDTGASVKKAVDACHPEVVAATVAVTVAMANP